MLDIKALKTGNRLTSRNYQAWLASLSVFDLVTIVKAGKLKAHKVKKIDDRLYINGEYYSLKTGESKDHKSRITPYVDGSPLQLPSTPYQRKTAEQERRAAKGLKVMQVWIKPEKIAELKRIVEGLNND